MSCCKVQFFFDCECSPSCSDGSTIQHTGSRVFPIDPGTVDTMNAMQEGELHSIRCTGASTALRSRIGIEY